MAKKPPELPLPPNFFGGDGPYKGGDNVIPFGRRDPPLKIRMPADEARRTAHHLSDEELIDLRAILRHPTARPIGAPPPDDVREVEDTPLNMLKDLVRRIETGEVPAVAAFVGMIIYKSDGTEDYPFYCTGLSRLAAKGLLTEYLENLP
jgi:hypothetical protein